MQTIDHDISQKVHQFAGRRQSDDPSQGIPWFRTLVVGALISTFWITWPLWEHRQYPFMLPALNLGLPSFSLGVPLIVASLGVLVAPRRGAIVLTALMLYGMAIDQTRMQPEYISLPLLLWGTLPNLFKGAQLVARAHLISLWFFSGVHKLLSPGFIADTGPGLVRALPIPSRTPENLVTLLAIGIAILEINTALLAIVPETRRVAAWSALTLHAGILLTLSPLAAARNEAVWPWNVALACSGFALIAPWTTTVVKTFKFATVPLATRALALLLLLSPAGYYLGVVDAYPAHHLYSSATARATVQCPSSCRAAQNLYLSWNAFNVPLPPEPRLFRALFEASCSPGDVLRIVEPYPPPWSGHGNIELISCRNGALPAAHP